MRRGHGRCARATWRSFGARLFVEEALLRLSPAFAVSVLLASGCTLSGTLDNIPHQDPVHLTDVNYQSSARSCPEVPLPSGCGAADVKCSYDTHGCEVCVCSSAP